MEKNKRKTARRIPGWKRAESERGDFYHRIRQFPRDVVKWRREFVEAAIRRPELFANVNSGVDATEVRALADEGISWFREIADILNLLYSRQPDRASADPLDEVVARLLVSPVIGLETARFAVGEIRATFGDWGNVRTARVPEIRRAVGIDLSSDVTRGIKSVLKSVCLEFESCDLNAAKKWNDDELREFLTTLPGVSPDDAMSIMADPMGRQVFVADRGRMRVLSRLGPYRALGMDLKRLHHSKRRNVVPTLLPPNLRLILNQRLATHGDVVCHEKQPDCDACELKKLCQHYRRNTVRTAEKVESATFIDLFCGAGGLSTGFVRAGCHPLLAADIDPVAMRTYALNHPQVPSDHALAMDIRELSAKRVRSLIGRRAPDVLVGAPPCQGFSLVGKRASNGRASEFHSVVDKKSNHKRDLNYRAAADPRNYLFEYMVALALEIRPKLFLMENVPGMKSSQLGATSFLDAAKERLEAGGYRAEIWRMSASAFGVPQDRTRLFLVASRLKAIPARPELEYRDLSARTFDDYALPPITFDEATFDLPQLESNSGNAVAINKRSPENSSRFKRYLRKFKIATDSKLIFNHRSRYQNDRDLELYELLLPGENSVAAVERYGRRDLMRYRQDIFDDKYMRLRADRPCRTILSHLAKDGNGYIHPEQIRSITVREAARLQSFDDDFVFCGAPRDQWVHVGNAVPPLLAQAIAMSFRSTLESSRRKS